MASSESSVRAEARQQRAIGRVGAWFVFWETPTRYGARGRDLTEEYARALASRINDTGDIHAEVARAQ